MSFKNKFKDNGVKPALPIPLQILQNVKDKNEDNDIERTKCSTEIKKKPTYFSGLKQGNSGSVVMTEAMAEVADVQSYDDRPNNVKEHSGGGEKSARVF